MKTFFTFCVIYFILVIYMKNVFKAIVSILLILMIITVPLRQYEALNQDEITDEILRRREKYFYGVINIWQVDCFEGGTGSRANWLKDICAGFERQNNGVYINVESVSPKMAKKLIESGQKKPDIISYGVGTGIKEEELKILELDTALTEILGAFYEKAVPWCMGAYFVIGDDDVSRWGNDGGVFETKKKIKTVYSIGVPEREGYDAQSALLKKCSNSFEGEYAIFAASSAEIFEAYNYSYKINRMVGTQRDFYRLNSAQSRQMAREGKITYLGYTDLFQYVSILNCRDEKKTYTMNKFIDYLLEKKQQDKLGSIGMFPVRLDAEPQYSVSYATYGWEEIKNKGIECSGYLFNN